MDKVGVWLANTNVTNAVVAVNDSSLSHERDELPLDNHRSHDNSNQNNAAAGPHKNVLNGLTIPVNERAQLASSMASKHRRRVCRDWMVKGRCAHLTLLGTAFCFEK
jgi:hypothetical protein